MRAALAGLGTAAERGHLPAIARTPGLTLVATADPDPSRRTAAKRALGSVPVFDDAATMLEHTPCDLLIIAAESSAHAQLAVLGADHGRHVLCEKPLALTAQQRDEVAQAFQQRPTLGLVSLHQYRFSPSWARIARLARWADRVGRSFAITIDLRRNGTDSTAVSTWRADVARSGGLMADHGVHYVALAWSISRHVEVLDASRSFDGLGREQAEARLQVGSGVLGLRLSAAEPERTTSITLNALGTTLRWRDAEERLTAGRRVLRRQTTMALSDRAHVDDLYGCFYTEVAQRLDDDAWRRFRTGESFAVADILVDMLHAA